MLCLFVRNDADGEWWIDMDVYLPLFFFSFVHLFFLCSTGVSRSTTATLFNNVIIELSYDRLHLMDLVSTDLTASLSHVLDGHVCRRVARSFSRSINGWKHLSRDISTLLEPIYPSIMMMMMVIVIMRMGTATMKKNSDAVEKQTLTVLCWLIGGTFFCVSFAIPAPAKEKDHRFSDKDQLICSLFLF